MRNMQYDIGTGENPIIFLKTEDLRRDGRVKILRLHTHFQAAVQQRKHANTLNFPQRELLY